VPAEIERAVAARAASPAAAPAASTLAQEEPT
jgi:hypothetical protein